MKTIIVILLEIVSICLIAYLISAQRVSGQEVIAYRPQNIKVYAFEQILNKWGDNQWSYFNDLIKKESQWNSEADNPNSTAYGLGQFLNSTWDDVGCEKTSDKYKQIDCTIDYIALRYGTPQKAITFHKKNNHY